jgi:predicted PurR-regulated permease PerM
LHDRLKIPAPLAALLLIAALFCVVAGIVALISVPASGWIARAPQSLPTLEDRFRFLAQPIDFLRHGMDQIQHLIQSAPPPGQQTVSVQQASGAGMGGVGMTLLNGTRAALGQMLTLAVVLFFLLSAGDGLLRRVVEIIPEWGDKRRMVEITMEIERNISGYLVTITLMNLLVGLANGLSMWALGMPDPLLWGVLAFLLNYIPIIGPVTGMVIFFFVGLFTSPSLLMAALPPAIYLVVHVIEGETVTPMLLARRFTLNPVILIITFFFWDWLWGIPGALLAVPLLAIVKIVCDRIPSLTPLGHLLGASSKG